MLKIERSMTEHLSPELANLFLAGYQKRFDRCLAGPQVTIATANNHTVYRSSLQYKTESCTEGRSV